jgi:hypothetical protein
MVRMWGAQLVPRFCRAACCLVGGTAGTSNTTKVNQEVASEQNLS